MEPVSTTISVLVCEYALKPIADSIKREYGDETKKLLKGLVNNVLTKEKLDSKAMEVIEAEIVEADIEVLSDKDKFLAFMANNHKIKTIENSFIDVDNSKIDINLGENGKVFNSVHNIKDSIIKIK